MFKHILIIAFVISMLASHKNAQAQNQCLGLGPDTGQCVPVSDQNAEGTPLELCSIEPLTGFYRNGYCQTGEEDVGTHVACAKVTQEFLEFSKSRGNDLISAAPRYRFPGLKDGDHWCLCAARWMEALEAGVAPPLVIEATHQKMLDYTKIETLEKYALINTKPQIEPSAGASDVKEPTMPKQTLKQTPIGAYQFSFTSIDGQDMPLSAYQGKVLLVVNTASQCGFTGQYEGLQTLHETYKDRGLVVIGVPCNNFGGQEPGSEEDIKEFVSSKYGITFPMTQKYAVKGNDVHPFFEWASGEGKGGFIFSKPRWNFHKFLIGPDGQLVKSFGSQVKPASASITNEIEKLLQQTGQ